jgi:hypothetical protein
MLYRLRFDYYSPNRYESLTQPGVDGGRGFAIHDGYRDPRDRRSETSLGVVDTATLTAMSSMEEGKGRLRVKDIRGQKQVSYISHGEGNPHLLIIAEPVNAATNVNEVKIESAADAFNVIEGIYDGTFLPSLGLKRNYQVMGPTA